MKIKPIAGMAAILFTLSSSAGQISDIKNEVENLIDGDCELSLDGGRAFQSMSNELINEVNSKVGAILDSYDLDCLAGLLSIPGLDIPGFDFNFSVDSYCEIARDVLFDGAGRGMTFTSPAEATQFENVKETVKKRYLETQQLKNELKKKNDQ